MKKSEYQKIKISIIIPIYNGERTIKACLKSISSQTYKNYELIIVDNNSTDQTKEIVNKFQIRDQRIHYIFEKQQGRGVARNTGIKCAKGEIIIMTDADCIVPQNWIEELTKPIIYENEKAVMGGEYDLVQNYWTKKIQNASEEFIKINIYNDIYIHHLDTKNFAIKASIIKRYLFDSNIMYMEDFALYVKLNNVCKIRFLSDVKVGHNHRSSMIKWAITNGGRGFWVGKIFNKYKLSHDFHPMVMSMSLTNWMLFPVWLIYQLFNQAFGNFCFVLISEVSWRVGILLSILSNVKI